MSISIIIFSSWTPRKSLPHQLWHLRNAYGQWYVAFLWVEVTQPVLPNECFVELGAAIIIIEYLPGFFLNSTFISKTLIYLHLCQWLHVPRVHHWWTLACDNLPYLPWSFPNYQYVQLGANNLICRGCVFSFSNILAHTCWRIKFLGLVFLVH